MTTLRLVIFDVDGTLIDSQHEIIAAMTAAFAAIGKTAPPRERILSIVGLSLHEAMKTLAPELPEIDILALVENYKESFLGAKDRDGQGNLVVNGGVLTVLPFSQVANWKQLAVWKCVKVVSGGLLGVF